MTSRTSEPADEDVGSPLDAEMSWTIEDVYPVLRRWFRQRVQNDFVADDLVQETMLSARTARASLRDPDAVGQWLYRIARNVLWMYYRAAGRQSIMSADVSEEMSQRVYDQPAKPFEDWSIATIRLQDMFARLSPRDGLVLKLHDHDGVNGRELARQLGVSEKTARKRVVRARDRARLLLTGDR